MVRLLVTTALFFLVGCQSVEDRELEILRARRKAVEKLETEDFFKACDAATRTVEERMKAREEEDRARLDRLKGTVFNP